MAWVKIVVNVECKEYLVVGDYSKTGCIGFIFLYYPYSPVHNFLGKLTIREKVLCEDHIGIKVIGPEK